MDAKRLQLLGAFAAGCVATLAFIGSRGTDAETKPKDGVEVRTEMPHAIAASLVDSADNSVRVDAPAKVANAEGEGDAKTESGSSVAEVLERLEAAYREEFGREKAAREEAAVLHADPEQTASIAAEIAAGAPIATAAEVAPAPSVAATPAATADLVAAAPAPTPVLVAQSDAPPRTETTGNSHAADTPRNITVGGLHPGDAYALQQQLALIQYIQLLTRSQQGTVAAPSQTSRQLGQRRPPAFSMNLTNPDNPWGFDFPPPVLVK